MKHGCKTLSVFLAFLIALAPVITLLPALPAAAVRGGEEGVLFSTSFEKDEMPVNGDIVGSSGVIHTAYGIRGKGYAVSLDTVGGSADYLGSENKYNLFDGKNATKFLTGSSTCVIYFALTEEAAVNCYEITSANDEPTRDPKSWSFYGSDDGETWTLLDSRTKVSFPGRYAAKSFSFANTTPYLWYMLDVTENAGAGMTQFAALELYTREGDVGGDSSAVLPVDTDRVSGTAADSTSQALTNLFDGSADTKYLTRNGSCYVTFALDAAAVVKCYSITSANDQPKRDPTEFYFYGSADGNTWTQLDHQSGVSFSERKKEKIFTIADNAAPYLWYKLDVISNGGVDDFGYTIIQMAELSLYPSIPQVDEDPIPSEVDISSVTATEYYGAHSPDLAFDGSSGTKYLVMDSQSASIAFRLETAEVVTRYALTNGNDHLERDPRDWAFYGSTDGSAWVLLDEQSNEDFPQAVSTNVYHFENETAYLWYKLEISAVHGPDTWFDKYVVHLAEIAVYTEENWHEQTEPEEVIDENGPFSVVLSSVQGTNTVSTDEGKTKLFDADEATKACFPATTVWFSFRVNRADAVTAYAVTSANDWANRDPEDWSLYGSNDGETWTLIDEQTGVSFGSRYETKTFRLASAASYLYYKCEITKNAGNTGYTQLSDFTLMTAEEVPEPVPGADAVKDFGPTQTETGKAGAWTGRSTLAVYGEQNETASTYARIKVFDGLNIPVSLNTVFSYHVFPGLFNMTNYDYEYTSCRVILDLYFTDGTVLSSLNAEDQYGSVLSPAGQVAGECLYTGQWNYIESRVGDVAVGKTISRIDAFFEMASAEDASKFITFFDDVKIENKNPVVYEHLSDYINILRGTNNDKAFSRGLCTPGVTMPNGFNFYTPVTNPANATASYNYQINGDNNPLDSISVMHAPSYWLGSYGTWQFMPNTSVVGTATVKKDMITSEARSSKFSHENEIAHAHYYSVTLDEDTPAGGVKIEITPTDHAAYVRFTFPEYTGNVNIIFDSLWGGTNLPTFIATTNSFKQTTTHTSAGGGKMYVVGQFDQSWVKAQKVGTKQGVVTFERGTTTVTMKIATSFISYAQAQHNLDLEIGNKDFDGVFNEAQSAWDALCGKFEIEGATYTQLLTFYSCLYRMYAYPNLYSENEGTNEEPSWVYASPYNNGAKTQGILYTNNGFWDTYRTTWAGYSLFTSEKDGEMLDGIVQHYIDSGWVPRWICPGAVNCMVGTSSDIIFADAYLKGIDFNYTAAWESMLKNASAYAENQTAGGRRGSNIAPYLGYLPNEYGEGYSCTQAGWLDDYGLYRMALAMGLEDEAEYYFNRCMSYPTLFNPNPGFFMGKSTSGIFSASGSDYDPAGWGGPRGDYTESVGWVNTFPAVYDGEGLAALYGGREALAEKLNTLFDDSIESMRKVVNGIGHEIVEFKEVKMGQYEHNNQPSHHVIYTYAFSSEPYKVQRYTREVLRHVYCGSEIGQGYPGDEDNGEMSAWYIFNALGFYPYCPASGEYVIGSPLFDKVTVHLDNGNDLVIIANNNSKENVYIQSASVNGAPIDRMYLTHEELTNGCTVVFNMGNTPSSFGSADSAKPASISAKGANTAFVADVTNDAILTGSAYTGQTLTAETQVYSDIPSVRNLFDGDSLTTATFESGASIVLTGSKPTAVDLITVTCAGKSAAPTSVKIEASNNGTNWTTLAENELTYLCDYFLTPSAVPQNVRRAYTFYRLTFTGGTTLSEVEFFGRKSDGLLRGDVNLDGVVDINDVSALLNCLSMTASQLETSIGAGVYSEQTLDVNSDGAYSILDVTELLNILSGASSGNHREPYVPEAFTPGAAYQNTNEHVSVVWSYLDPEGESSEGTVTVAIDDASAAGEYTVYYGDDGGVLSGVKALGSVTLSSAGENAVCFRAGEKTAPALSAKSIVVTDGNGGIVAYSEIPACKRSAGGWLLGSFAAISDVHVFENAPYNGQYDSINGTEDLQLAVNRINAAGVDFTAITGDLILSFMSDADQINAELTKSTNILNGLDAPCYVVKGNHDKKVDEIVWKQLTGCNLDYAFTFGEARFIFLSLKTVQNVDSVDESPYGQAKMDWLENELTAHSDKRVLLFMHYPVSGTAGLIPGNSYGFSAGSVEEARLVGMLRAHGDVTVFNGHTHFDFEASETYPDISVSRLDDLNSYFVHLPSVAYPRNASNVTHTEESEGYIVRVLENGLLLEGMDFVTGEFDPSATVYLDTRAKNNALTTGSVTLAAGQTTTVETASPYTSAEFYSTDPAVAVVDAAGHVTAQSTGSAVIICRIDGFTYKLNVKVVDQSSLMQGSGTESDPYILTTADHFVYIQNEFRGGNDLSGVYFAMGNDICLNDSANYRPAGSTEGGTFAGYFDGRGHILSATTTLSSEDFAVPYFYNMTGTIVNTTFECTMGGCKKTSYVVARTMNGGKLVNCIVRGSVYASNVNTTIICGTSSGTVIANCFIDVTVSGTTPGTSESGVTMKGSGTVTNVLYVPNGCTASHGETAITDKTAVAAAMNGTVSSSASASGIPASAFCSWQTDSQGVPQLIAE